MRDAAAALVVAAFWTLHTVLGAPYYRVGGDADAINSLWIATRLNPEPDSANLAFHRDGAATPRSA